MPKPFTQNDQIWHYIYILYGVAGFRSATPLHLHTCVARFVSESRVSCLKDGKIMVKSSSIVYLLPLSKSVFHLHL